MSKEIRVYLEDILESIRHIQTYTQGQDFQAFERDMEKQDAVVWRLEIIGEAVKHLPEAVRILYPDIPWKNIAGMHNILIHEYSYVSLDRVWSVVTDHLHALKQVTEKILAESK